MAHRLITIGCLIGLSACGLLDGNNDSHVAEGNLSTESLYENQVEVFQQDHLLMSHQDDLVLELPEDIDIRATDIDESAFYQATQFYTDCQYSDGSLLSFVLAQACVLYQEHYLFDHYLPNSLDGIQSVPSFVQKLQEHDRYTHYLGPEYFSSVVETISGARATIGLSLVLTEGSCPEDMTLLSRDERLSEGRALRIRKISPYSRGWWDGFQECDEIVAVNDVTIAGLLGDDVFDLLPTQEGEAVSLTIRREDQLLTIPTAAELHISHRLDHTQIAYLSVREFTTLTGQRVKEDLEVLLELGDISGAILDLRDNGGGSVAGTLELVDYLIGESRDEETIVKFRDRDDRGEDYRLGDYLQSNTSASLDKENFVVLINGGSASASEITLNALVHYGVATSLGDRSFGKGVSQHVFSLLDDSGVLITHNRILSPSGTDYHNQGVLPDYCLTTTATSRDNDPQLQGALVLLQGQTPDTNNCTGLPLEKPQIRSDPWLMKYQDRIY
jgi:C-terminal peptidase prc